MLTSPEFCYPFQKYSRVIFAFAVGIVLIVRFYFCGQVPDRTTDAFRNIGYTSHFWTLGTDIYKSVASDFKPEIWTENWSEVGYIYPPLTLVFFSIFSLFGAGIVWVKLLLTLCDVGSAVIIAKHSSKRMGLLLLATPSMVWWTSHEGQFESLQLFMMLVCSHFILKKKWFLAGVFLMLGVQTKIFSVLLIPFLMAQLFIERDKIYESTKKILLGIFVGILPFFPFYIKKPTILFMPLLENTNRSFNPFAWNLSSPEFVQNTHKWIMNWSATFSYVMIVVLVIFTITIRKKKFDLLSSLSPSSFWLILKSLKWAHVWYPIQFAGLLLSVVNYRRIFALLLILNFCQDGTGLAFTFGFGNEIKDISYKVEHMKKCLWNCDYKQLDLK